MLNEVIKKKKKHLEKILKNSGRILVAYSGGVDSTFLLKSAVECLGAENVGAFIEESEVYPDSEISFAKKFAESLGVGLFIVSSKKLSDKRFSENSRDRCFYCKKNLFSKMSTIAKKNRFNTLADGSNLDDLSDYRPGNRAKSIYQVISPLQQACLSKKDIRILSKEMHLPTWNKPQMACLATRIPYGEKITVSRLKRVLFAEKYLKNLGFTTVRARDYNRLCRIEVCSSDIKKVIKFREDIVETLKKIGYTYITLDLEGYKTGSMNKTVKP